jgi:hypothetical protein
MSNKIFSIIALSLLLAFSACEKIDPQDNAPTISVPYALFVGGIEGQLWKTNDGVNFDRWYQSGSSFSNELFVADTNIIHIKQKVSVGRGVFPYYPTPVNSFTPLTNPVSAEKPSQMNIACHDKSNKLVWCCSNPTLVYTDDNGKNWKQYVSPPPVVNMGVLTSVITLDNDYTIALNIANKLFFNNTGLPTTAFAACNTTVAPLFPATFTTAGVPDWALAKDGNTAWVIDENGNYQPYFSTNNAANFTQSSGLPNKRRVNMAKEVEITGDFYVGTDSAGLFRLNNTTNTFQRIATGLPQNLRIWDIEGKRNTYLTGETKDYIYLATDQGLYISENNGNEWRLIDGTIRCSNLR